MTKVDLTEGQIKALVNLLNQTQVPLGRANDLLPLLNKLKRKVGDLSK